MVRTLRLTHLTFIYGYSVDLLHLRILRILISCSCLFQEQYEFLHHALVHTLTLACAQIPADTFPQYMVTSSAAEFAQQFKASLKLH